MAYNRLDQIVSNIAPRTGSGASDNSLSELVRSLAPGNGQAIPDAVAQATRQLEELKVVNQNHAELLAANTQAISQSNAGRSGSGGAGAGGNFASSFLGNALSFLPLVSGLMKLFGGGGSQPQPLVRYSAPAALHVDEAAGTGAAIYDQYGAPKTAASMTQNLTGLAGCGKSV